MTAPKLTEAQRRDLESIDRCAGPARAGRALWRLGLAAAVPSTGIHHGPTIWRSTTAGRAALRGES